jgi:ATP-dependent Lon protease
VAVRFASGVKKKVNVTPPLVREFLGLPKYRADEALRTDQIGAAMGLAWTAVGGDILVVEARAVRGKGNLQLTGQLGDVMKESAQAALTFARSRAERLGLVENYFETHDVHVHVPEGAIPKDGPSAGITMATAMISAFSGRPVWRDLAMTGEITLRGEVLPIGGVKEKVLAARRAGLKKVLLPRENERDLEEIPAELKKDLKFTFVGTVDDVLAAALAPPASLGRSSRRKKGPNGRKRKAA